MSKRRGPTRCHHRHRRGASAIICSRRSASEAAQSLTNWRTATTLPRPSSRAIHSGRSQARNNPLEGSINDAAPSDCAGRPESFRSETGPGGRGLLLMHRVYCCSPPVGGPPHRCGGRGQPSPSRLPTSPRLAVTAHRRRPGQPAVRGLDPVLAAITAPPATYRCSASGVPAWTSSSSTSARYPSICAALNATGGSGSTEAMHPVVVQAASVEPDIVRRARRRGWRTGGSCWEASK